MAAPTPPQFLIMVYSSTTTTISLGFMMALLVVVSIWTCPGSHAAGVGAWEQAHATFYGGSDASGTMGTHASNPICIHT